MQVEITPEETAVLIGWKKRTDNYEGYAKLLILIFGDSRSRACRNRQ